MIRIKLKAVLAEKGIKQKDLVEMTGIRQPTLSGMTHPGRRRVISCDACSRSEGCAAPL